MHKCFLRASVPDLWRNFDTTMLGIFFWVSTRFSKFSSMFDAASFFRVGSDCKLSRLSDFIDGSM